MKPRMRGFALPAATPIQYGSVQYACESPVSFFHGSVCITPPTALPGGQTAAIRKFLSPIGELNRLHRLHCT